MKTSNLPSLRVSAELREAAEGVLREGETLSAFIETSVKESIDRRRLRDEFIARGLASRDEARRTGEYFPAEAVHAELAALREASRSGRSTPGSGARAARTKSGR